MVCFTPVMDAGATRQPAERVREGVERSVRHLKAPEHMSCQCTACTFVRTSQGTTHTQCGWGISQVPREADIRPRLLRTSSLVNASGGKHLRMHCPISRSNSTVHTATPHLAQPLALEGL